MQQSTYTSSDDFNYLKDGRVFFPSFNDGGLNYNLLVEATNCVNQEESLQKLIQELSANYEKLSEIPFNNLQLRAAALILLDLLKQGWIIKIVQDQIVVYPKTAQTHETIKDSKDSTREAGLFARNDQLSDLPVRRFILEKELPGRFSSSVPITNLIGDGRKLRELLEPVTKLPKIERGKKLRQIIKPYLQLVSPEKRCELTGIKLSEIWRYFRYNWSIPYNTSPGRNLFFLIRDAGQPYHPVMAITALGNSMLQLTDRDMRLGWTTEGFVQLVEKGVISSPEAITTLVNSIDKSLSEIYIEDLPLKVSELESPTDQTISRLIAARDNADLQRQAELESNLKPVRIEFNENTSEEILLKETTRSLYKFKRAKSLAELLRAKITLKRWEGTENSSETLKQLLIEEEGQTAVGIALRQARNRMVGSAMMEIIVCGGIQPYSSLLSGKLACLIMLSPEVAKIYEDFYGNQISIIASQMAGRLIRRPAKLVHLGTTSLYSIGSSQYNRVFLPKGTLPNQDIDFKYQLIGETIGYGSAHLSRETVQTLNYLENESKRFRRVNHVFGEGASPKLRQLSSSLSNLGLAQANLLRHASKRLIYSIPLIRNIERYLLEIDKEPDTFIQVEKAENISQLTEKISTFWIDRWLSSRLDHTPIFDQLTEATPLKLRVSKSLPTQIDILDNQLKFEFEEPVNTTKEISMNKVNEEKLEYIRRLYREESAFADNIKINKLRDIHIKTNIESVIEELIKRNACVVLTGNAGDGKTHLIRLLEQKLKNNNAYIVPDASAEDLDELVKKWNDSLKSGKASCIAINEGPLLDIIAKYRKEYEFLEKIREELKVSRTYVELSKNNPKLKINEWKFPEDATGNIYVIDLSLRQNLSKDNIKAVLNKLTNSAWYETCKSCSNQKECPVTYNQIALSNSAIQDRISKLLENVSVRGHQVTFRELMSFGSFLIFGGRNCDEFNHHEGYESTRYYNNFFDNGEGIIFEELRKGLDPVSCTHSIVDEQLWKGEFSAEDFPFDPKPVNRSFDNHSTSNDTNKNLQDFSSLKRRWYFEHPEGKKIRPQGEADRFLDKLRDVEVTPQSRISELLRLLNRYLYSGDKDVPDFLRLWTQLAFSPRNKSKAMVSGKHVSSQALYLYEPKLSSFLERCFGSQPVDHILLGPIGEQLRFANLRVDIKLLALLISRYGKASEDLECYRRISRFNDALSNYVKSDNSDFRIVTMVEGRSGRHALLRIDLQGRRYDGLDNAVQ